MVPVEGATNVMPSCYQVLPMRSRGFLGPYKVLSLVWSTVRLVGAGQLTHHDLTVEVASYAASDTLQLRQGAGVPYGAGEGAAEATFAEKQANVSWPIAWPDFSISIAWPLNGTRVIGTDVPIQTSVTSAEIADLRDYARWCTVVHSAALVGDTVMTISHPLGHKPASTDPYILYPGEYEGSLDCVGDEAEMRICRMPSRHSGARRTWVRVECADPAHPTNTHTVAAVPVDYHVTLQRDIDSIESHSRMPSLPLSKMWSFGNRELLYLGVHTEGDDEDQAKEFCATQGLERGIKHCAAFIRQAMQEHRDARYHAYVGAMMRWLHSRGVDLSAMEGTTYAAIQKLHAMKAIVQKRRPKRVCEIGFNAGHSALLWLLYGGVDTSVLAFDLGEHSYSHLALEWIVQRTGPRLTVVMGTSVRTVPAYANMHAGAGQMCDLIFVDGGHQGEVPLLDMLNMMALANRTDHVVLVDDTNAQDVWAAVNAMTAVGKFEVNTHHKSSKAPVFQHVEGALWYTWQRGRAEGLMTEGRYIWRVSEQQ